jgi:hypothetical protein
MATTYIPAPEVKDIAQELINQYHTHLADTEVRIEYVFCDNVPKKGDKEIWGTMRKVTNLYAFLASSKEEQDVGNSEAFFVMTISKPVWDVLTLDQKKALVDHELCHAMTEINEDTGEPKLTVVPHDLEEFAVIVKRYGLWRDDVKHFVSAANEGESNHA